MIKQAIDAFTAIAKSQGFTVAVLVALMVWMSYQDHQNRELRSQEIRRLQEELDQCGDRVLEFYRTDHDEMRRQLEKNNDLLERRTK